MKINLDLKVNLYLVHILSLLHSLTNSVRQKCNCCDLNLKIATWCRKYLKIHIFLLGSSYIQELAVLSEDFLCIFCLFFYLCGCLFVFFLAFLLIRSYRQFVPICYFIFPFFSHFFFSWGKIGNFSFCNCTNICPKLN